MTEQPWLDPVQVTALRSVRCRAANEACVDFEIWRTGEQRPELSGTVKWDGCCNFGTDGLGPAHLCGVEQADDIADCIRDAYRQATWLIECDFDAPEQRTAPPSLSDPEDFSNRWEQGTGPVPNMTGVIKNLRELIEDRESKESRGARLPRRTVVPLWLAEEIERANFSGEDAFLDVTEHIAVVANEVATAWAKTSGVTLEQWLERWRLAIEFKRPDPEDTSCAVEYTFTAIERHKGETP